MKTSQDLEHGATAGGYNRRSCYDWLFVCAMTQVYTLGYYLRQAIAPITDVLEHGKLIIQLFSLYIIYIYIYIFTTVPLRPSYFINESS